MNYFVTAIGTDSGKTVASAVLCHALKADYWKPIQAGTPRDAETVKALCPEIKIHEERYLLTQPLSPHAAAAIDKKNILLKDIVAPAAAHLTIEGAGGCLAPVNDREFVIEIAKKTNAEVIVVANLYLGSLNHTMLTLYYLKQNQYRVKGIILNGDAPSSEEYIRTHSPYPILLKMKPEKTITREVIEKYSKQLNPLQT